MMHREYMREHPYWYVILEREPEKYSLLEKEITIQRQEELKGKLNQLSLLVTILEMMT